MKYVMRNNIIYRHQSDFRENNSTYISLSYLADNILTGFDSVLLTEMIFINLFKAVDIINQYIFLKNIASPGFSNHSIIWFQSYISYRSFPANIKNEYSTFAKSKRGVPLGSFLPPLLFPLFISDMKPGVDWDLLLYGDRWLSCLAYPQKLFLT